MSITQEFVDSVNEKNIRKIRIILKDSLIVDPTFKEFDEMLKLVKLSGLNLYDKHNGEVLKYDEKEWTKDYMNMQMVQLIYNFSEERVNLLKDICKKLYLQRIQMIENERKNSSNRQIKITKDKVSTGLIALGTVSMVGQIAIGTAKAVCVAAGEIGGEVAIESAIAAGVTAGMVAIKPVIIATGVSMIVIGGAIKVIGGK